MRWSKVCEAANQPHRGAHYSEMSLCVKEFGGFVLRAFDLPGSGGAPLPARFSFRRGSDPVDAQVRTVEFFFRIEADTDQFFQRTIHRVTAREGDHHAK